MIEVHCQSISFFIDPQPYLEFIYLIKNSFAVITDSGGLSEETTVLRVPCLTIRNTTERPETVTLGTNQLITVNPKNFPKYFDNLFQGNGKVGLLHLSGMARVQNGS